MIDIKDNSIGVQMQVVTLEISDDYYDNFLHLLDALPVNKVSLKKRKSSMSNEIDGRIDKYLKDKSIAVDFTSSMQNIKEKLLASNK